MTITNTIPRGWEFYTADFSRRSGDNRSKGTVTLIRDNEGRKIWHGFSDEITDLDDCILFASGQGNTIEEALESAINLAKTSKPLNGWES